MTRVMKIAIVDDEKDMRQSISQWLALSGYDTQSFASAKDALAVIDSSFPGIVIMISRCRKWMVYNFFANSWAKTAHFQLL
jgi:DNA-binding NtrC family response regulator